MNETEHAAQNDERVRFVVSELSKPLSGEHVAQRQGGRGMMLDYLPAHYVIEKLNEIFDYDWDDEIVGIKLLNDRVYQCVVKLTVRYGGRSITKQDVGIGRVQANLITDDELEKCLKEAASDALKRCARKLGNQFGNSLYNKDHSQRYDAGPDAPPVAAQAPQRPVVPPRYQSAVAQPTAPPAPQQPQQQGAYGPPDPNKLRVVQIPANEDPAKCRECGNSVWWVTNPKSGKKMPANGDGTIHFDTCSAKTNDPALTRHNNTAVGSDPNGSAPMASNSGEPMSQAQMDEIVRKAVNAYGEDGYIENLEALCLGNFGTEEFQSMTKVQGIKMGEILDRIIWDAEGAMPPHLR